MTNLVDVITAAYNAVGGPASDWRVQGAAFVTIAVIGAAIVVVNRIKKKKSN
jgi:hypothetical protein